MIAWYWAYTSRVAQRDLYRIGSKHWLSIDYSNEINLEKFNQLFDFLGLTGFSEDKVTEILDSKVNTIVSKFKTKMDRFPSWLDWSEETSREFDGIAASAMVEMGYYEINKLPFNCDASKYNNFNLRAAIDPMQTELWNVIRQNFKKEELKDIKSVLWIGASPPDLPSYITEAIHWNNNPLGSIPEGKYDLVAALGVMDFVPDMDRFLIALTERAAKHLVITSSRGHFENLFEHSYGLYDKGEYRNRWCIAKTQSLLIRQLGFSRVNAQGLSTSDNLRPELTCLTAKR
jgi:hypothetical protein